MIATLLEIYKDGSFKFIGPYSSGDLAEQAIQTLISNDHEYYNGTDSEEHQKLNHYRIYLVPMDCDLSQFLDLGIMSMYRVYNKYTGLYTPEEK